MDSSIRVGLPSVVGQRLQAEVVGLPGPSKLWFEVDGQTPSPRSEAFAVALLPIAMARNVPLEIEGPICTHLARGMVEYQKVLTSWWPRNYSEIDLRGPRDIPSPSEHKLDIASSFSGGVDSFYSLWQHTVGSTPNGNYRLNRVLMIHGFDVDDDIDAPERFDTLVSLYRPLFERLEVRPLRVRTNLKRFRASSLPGARLHDSFGASLTAAAHAAQDVLQTFMIPGSLSYDRLVPEGAHPALDHLLSSRTLQIRHDGAHATRPDKVRALVGWPASHSHLRVCWDPTYETIRPGESRAYNCGRCHKCVRTMVALEALGALARFGVFDRPIDNERIRQLRHLTPAARAFVAENVELCREANRPDLVRALQVSLARSWLHITKKRVLREVDRARRQLFS